MNVWKNFGENWKEAVGWYLTWFSERLTLAVEIPFLNLNYATYMLKPKKVFEAFFLWSLGYGFVLVGMVWFRAKLILMG